MVNVVSEFNNLVQEIVDWQGDTFPASTMTSKVYHLMDEIQELLQAVEGNSITDEIDLELADCFLLLIGAAAKHGLDGDGIKSVIRKKLEINKKRKWGKPDHNGVVNHIQ